MSQENLIIIILVSIIIVILFIMFYIISRMEKNLEIRFEQENAELRQHLLSTTMESLKNMSDVLSNSQLQFAQSQHLQMQAMDNSIEQKMDAMLRENSAKLADMRQLVEEKLQKTLDDSVQQSYSIVAAQLEQVHRGLGEMQSLANGVGDLRRVLTNVKTRGILGEVQLKMILQDFLNNDMYEENVETVAGSGNRVEFAIRLPSEDDSFIWLPVDSKFPADSYNNLQSAYDGGNKALIENYQKVFIATIKKEAKDIHDKYVYPPQTTDFGIMFVPTEGIYQEILALSLAETLQKEYRVTVAGPTTMAGLLNALQMGFRTLAVQKRSQEVWNLLGEVRSEFDRFAEVLSSTQQKLEQTSGELDKLVGVRTRQMRKKLSAIDDNPLFIDNREKE
ncbi:MAG: DNA recombination protein RmuC [Erysipelotrichaceae bacterium]|nr:DNA recombination protein RmuC [Erysipelotrichaceae bacterium]